ncbi:MAG: type I 3-dehydroquinate dehydratase [Luteitalea sp.]|nr:type I 3-dehydroquinate dehydratase [Luteitalea sp.]
MSSPTRLCGTVTGATVHELRRARDQVSALVDLVELRLDGLVQPDVAAVVADRPRPVIVTCRPAWEGGRFDGPEAVREQWLTDALIHGAEFVDVEWRAPFRDHLLQRDASRVVVSIHDFDGVPHDLASLVATMSATKAAVVKVAVTVQRLADLIPLLALGEQYHDRGIVVIGMGVAGVPSRILAARFGSRWTYGGDAVAPGQLPVTRLRDEFRFARITSTSDVYALVGRPTGHSASPAMHNAAFAALGVEAAYVPCEPADFDDFLAFAVAVGLRGCSVTRPFKPSALAAAAHADPLSHRVGAANTLRRVGQHWEACNTDVDGFLTPLRARRALQGLAASVVGGGGAARAVVAGLVAEGADVAVHARRRDQAEALTALGARVGDWPPCSRSCDVLVNTTPVGTWPNVDALPVSISCLPGLAAGRARVQPGPAIVYDLVANPAETRLLREARARGCETISGLEMLVAQGAHQCEWWTGRPAPVEVMRDAAHRRLEHDSLSMPSANENCKGELDKNSP